MKLQTKFSKFVRNYVMHSILKLLLSQLEKITDSEDEYVSHNATPEKFKLSKTN